MAWNSLSIKHKKRLSGINVLCKDNVNLKIIGEEYPKDGFITNQLNLTYKYKIRGEKWGCVRTDLLIKIPYPEILGRGNYIQAYTWFSLSKKYDLVCYNNALRTYYIDELSITKQKNLLKKREKEAKTRVHFLKWHLNNHAMYLMKTDFKSFLKALIAFWNFSFYLENDKDKLSGVNFIPKVFLIVFFAPTFIYNKCERRKL